MPFYCSQAHLILICLQCYPFIRALNSWQQCCQKPQPASGLKCDHLRCMQVENMAMLHGRTAPCSASSCPGSLACPPAAALCLPSNTVHGASAIIHNPEVLWDTGPNWWQKESSCSPKQSPVCADNQLSAELLMRHILQCDWKERSQSLKIAATATCSQAMNEWLANATPTLA